MQIKELLLSLPLLVFVLWIFIAPVPEQRMERFCAPIGWVGNLTTSTTALTKEEHTATAQSWADKMQYSCEYLLWRLFYQKDYNQAIEDGLIVPPASYEYEKTGDDENEDDKAFSGAEGEDDDIFQNED